MRGDVGKSRGEVRDTRFLGFSECSELWWGEDLFGLPYLLMSKPGMFMPWFRSGTMFGRVSNGRP